MFLITAPNKSFLSFTHLPSNSPLCRLISFSFSFSLQPLICFLPNFALHLSLTLSQIFFLLPLLRILKGHKNFPFSCPKLFVYLSPPHYNKIILPFRCHLTLALSPSTLSFSPGLKTDQHFLIGKATIIFFPSKIPQVQYFH